MRVLLVPLPRYRQYNRIENLRFWASYGVDGLRVYQPRHMVGTEILKDIAGFYFAGYSS